MDASLRWHDDLGERLAINWLEGEAGASARPRSPGLCTPVAVTPAKAGVHPAAVTRRQHGCRPSLARGPEMRVVTHDWRGGARVAARNDTTPKREWGLVFPPAPTHPGIAAAHCPFGVPIAFRYRPPLGLPPPGRGSFSPVGPVQARRPGRFPAGFDRAEARSIPSGSGERHAPAALSRGGSPAEPRLLQVSFGPGPAVKPVRPTGALAANRSLPLPRPGSGSRKTGPKARSVRPRHTVQEAEASAVRCRFGSDKPKPVLPTRVRHGAEARSIRKVSVRKGHEALPYHPPSRTGPKPRHVRRGSGPPGRSLSFPPARPAKAEASPLQAGFGSQGPKPFFPRTSFGKPKLAAPDPSGPKHAEASPSPAGFEIRRERRLLPRPGRETRPKPRLPCRFGSVGAEAPPRPFASSLFAAPKRPASLKARKPVLEAEAACTHPRCGSRFPAEAAFRLPRSLFRTWPKPHP